MDAIGPRLDRTGCIHAGWKKCRGAFGGTIDPVLGPDTGKEKKAFKSADSHQSERWNDFAIAPNERMLAIGGVDAEAESRGFVDVWNLDGGAGRQ